MARRRRDYIVTDRARGDYPARRSLLLSRFISAPYAPASTRRQARAIVQSPRSIVVRTQRTAPVRRVVSLFYRPISISPTICKSRRTRREVLFANSGGGSPRFSGRPRFTDKSRERC